MRKIIVSIIALAAIAACTSIDCPVKNTVNTAYELLSIDGTADTLNSDTLWIWSRRSNGEDTLLLNSLTGSSATNFSLPISHTLPEDTLYTLLKVDSTAIYLDTILIKKENLPHFESVDCQATYFHRLTAVRSSHWGIDSIVINYDQVNYDATKTHFHLYLKADR